MIDFVVVDRNLALHQRLSHCGTLVFYYIESPDQSHLKGATHSCEDDESVDFYGSNLNYQSHYCPLLRVGDCENTHEAW